MFKSKVVYLFLLLLISAGLSCIHFFRIDLFERFSLLFNDINFSLQDKQISKKVVLVAVDEASINRYGRWGWDRKIIAIIITTTVVFITITVTIKLIYYSGLNINFSLGI